MTHSNSLSRAVRRGVALFFLLCGVSAAASAQVTEQWVARYNGPGNGPDSARAICLDALGNIYVAGTSRGDSTGDDYVVVKYDPDGTELWVARYNGPADGADTLADMKCDPDGNVYVTGSSAGVDTQSDYTTVKYDAEGNELWVAQYDGPASLADVARAIILDGDANVYVTGESEISGLNFRESATIKYDPGGNPLWVDRRLPPVGPGNRSASLAAMAFDPDGNLIVTGSFGNRVQCVVPPPPRFHNYRRVYSVKYAPSGKLVWERIVGSLPPCGPNPFLLQVGTAIAVDADGNAYVTGSVTVKYSPDGTQLWLRTGILGQAVAWDGNVYVTGRASERIDFRTRKYDPAGNQLWSADYNGPGDDFDVAAALGLDSVGNVYVTGRSPGLGTGDDYATLKYDADGNELWVARHDGPTSGEDRAAAIFVDPKGNLFVTGTSVGKGTGNDFLTIKYVQK